MRISESLKLGGSASSNAIIKALEGDESFLKFSASEGDGIAVSGKQKGFQRPTLLRRAIVNCPPSCLFLPKNRRLRRC